MDVVDKRAQRRDAQATCNAEHVVAAHQIEREAASEGSADAHDIAALHFVEHLGEGARTAHAQLEEAFLGRRA